MLSKEQLEKIRAEVNARINTDTRYCRDSRRKLSPKDVLILQGIAEKFLIQRMEKRASQD